MVFRWDHEIDKTSYEPWCTLQVDSSSLSSKTEVPFCYRSYSCVHPRVSKDSLILFFHLIWVASLFRLRTKDETDCSARFAYQHFDWRVFRLLQPWWYNSMMKTNQKIFFLNLRRDLKRLYWDETYKQLQKATRSTIYCLWTIKLCVQDSNDEKIEKTYTKSDPTNNDPTSKAWDQKYWDHQLRAR